MRTATIEAIADGRPGLQAKVARIRSLVEKAKRDPHFRDRVHELLQQLPEKDHAAEISTLVEHVRRGVRYMRDPWSPTGLELFIEPQTMLADIESGKASGDCDDHVILASALLETAGYPTRYRVGGVPPDIYQHIWLDVQHPRKGWLPVELTRKDKPVGWDPSPRFPLVETLSDLPMKHRYTPGGALTTQLVDTKTRDPIAGTSYQTRYHRNAERVSADMARARNERVAASRRRGLRRGALGAPPSYENIVPLAQTALPYGSTPSDFLQMVDRGRINPDDFFTPSLGGELGFLKKLRKKQKKLRKRIFKTLKKASPIRMLAKKSPLLKMFKKKKRGPQQPGDEYAGTMPAGSGSLLPSAPAPEIYSPGTSFESAAGGWALPDGVPDQTSVWPEYEDAPMPDINYGSYIPTPDEFPEQPGDPYGVPAFDHEYGATTEATGFSPEYEFTDDTAQPDDAMHYGTLGAMEMLGQTPWYQDVLKGAAQTALAYQQAKLQQRAVAKGYIQAPPPPTMTAPVPGPERIIYRQSAPAPASALTKALPWVAVAAVGLLLLKR